MEKNIKSLLLQSSLLAGFVAAGWFLGGPIGAAAGAASVGPAQKAAELATGYASNLAANAVERVCGGLVSHFRQRGEDGRLDPNHDEGRALRDAQLSSLAIFFDRRAKGKGFKTSFADGIKKWISVQKAEFEDNALAKAGDVEAALRAVFPSTLAEKAGDAHGVTINLRKTAEDCVIAELAAYNHVMDAETEASFRHPEEGWFPLFANQAAAQIKHNPLMRDIWMAMRMAVVDQKADDLLAAFEKQRLALDAALFGVTPFTLDYDIVPVIDDERHRFSPYNPAIPFVGREAELQELDDFLNANSAAFSWHMVVGGGGAGKSRLAYELFKAGELRRDWKVGFLSSDPGNVLVEPASFNDWTLKCNHLIIIDYVLAKAEATKGLLTKAINREKPYGYKLRVLLIERAEDAFQQAQVFPSDANERRKLEQARTAGSSLQLHAPEPDEIWAMGAAVSGWCGHGAGRVSRQAPGG